MCVRKFRLAHKILTREQEKKIFADKHKRRKGIKKGSIANITGRKSGRSKLHTFASLKNKTPVKIVKIDRKYKKKMKNGQTRWFEVATTTDGERVFRFASGEQRI